MINLGGFVCLVLFFDFWSVLIDYVDCLSHEVCLFVEFCVVIIVISNWGYMNLVELHMRLWIEAFVTFAAI